MTAWRAFRRSGAEDEGGREEIQAEIDQVHGPGQSTMGRECGERIVENSHPQAGSRRVERDQNSRASQEEQPLAEQCQIEAAWPDDRPAHHPIELFRGETIGKLFLHGTVRELAGIEGDQQGRSKGGVSLFVVFAAPFFRRQKVAAGKEPRRARQPAGDGKARLADMDSLPATDVGTGEHLVGTDARKRAPGESALIDADLLERDLNHLFRNPELQAAHPLRAAAGRHGQHGGNSGSRQMGDTGLDRRVRNRLAECLLRRAHGDDHAGGNRHHTAGVTFGPVDPDHQGHAEARNQEPGGEFHSACPRSRRIRSPLFSRPNPMILIAKPSPTRERRRSAMRHGVEWRGRPRPSRKSANWATFHLPVDGPRLRRPATERLPSEIYDSARIFDCLFRPGASPNKR